MKYLTPFTLLVIPSLIRPVVPEVVVKHPRLIISILPRKPQVELGRRAGRLEQVRAVGHRRLRISRGFQDARRLVVAKRTVWPLPDGRVLLVGEKPWRAQVIRVNSKQFAAAAHAYRDGAGVIRGFAF